MRLAVALAACAVALGGGCSTFGRPKIELLTILLSGNTQSYVANCGCAGGQTGGELRQARVMREEHEAATAKAQDGHGLHAAVLIEMGNFSDPSTPVTRIQSEAVVEGLHSLQYDVVGLGSRELQYPQQDLLKLLGGSNLPLTCCNLKFVPPKPSFSDDKSAELNALLKPYRIVKLSNGYRVGVIHAIQTGGLSDVGGLYGYELSRPAETVQALMDQHKSEADYWILTVADADSQGATTGGIEKISSLDVVFGFPNGNPLQDESGKLVPPRILPAPYHKAKDLMRVRQYFLPDGTPGVLDDEALALRADVKYDDELNQSWEKRQIEMEKLSADQANALIASRQTAKPPFYVGQNACIECHSAIVSQMAGTKHLHAYVTLVEKGVERNASCLPCHVVGFGTPYGWNVQENQPSLQGVQCENCHGPASYHIDLYKKKAHPDDLEAGGRDKSGLLPASKASCLKCHTSDNSPNFDFDTYWPKIKH
jgi:hypothetical protein